jgi:hypothetical protein
VRKYALQNEDHHQRHDCSYEYLHRRSRPICGGKIGMLMLGEQRDLGDNSGSPEHAGWKIREPGAHRNPSGTDRMNPGAHIEN